MTSKKLPAIFSTLALTVGLAFAATEENRTDLALANSKPYSFVSAVKGNPSRWNVCEPIEYKINFSGVAKKEGKRWKRAFATLNQALGGAQFTYTGTTSQVPDDPRDVYDSGKDIAIAYTYGGSGPEKSSALTGGGIYSASSWQTPYKDKGDGYHVPLREVGMIVINKQHLSKLNGQQRESMYLQAAAYVANLNYSKNSNSVMYFHSVRDPKWPTKFSANDLKGLAQLGTQAGCMTLPVMSEGPEMFIEGDYARFVYPQAQPNRSWVQYRLEPELVNYQGQYRFEEGQELTIPLADLLVPAPSYSRFSRTLTLRASALNSAGGATSPARTITLPPLKFAEAPQPNVVVSARSVRIGTWWLVYEGTTTLATPAETDDELYALIHFKSGETTGQYMEPFDLFFADEDIAYVEVEGDIVYTNPDDGVTHSVSMTGTYTPSE